MNKEKVETFIAQQAVNATVKADKAVTTAARAICARKVTRYAFCLALAMATIGTTVFADEGDASAQVDSMIETINTWITRIGGVVIGFGAITTGIGIANQDDAGRNRGLMTMAGGAVVTGISIVLS